MYDTTQKPLIGGWAELFSIGHFLHSIMEGTSLLGEIVKICN